MPAPSFGKLRAASAHFGPSGNGTPYISDGDSARVLFFVNLSGAYDGNARAPEALEDMRIIAHRVNLHDELLQAAEAAMMALGRGGANVLGGPGRAEWEALQRLTNKARGN